MDQIIEMLEMSVAYYTLDEDQMAEEVFNLEELCFE